MTTTFGREPVSKQFMRVCVGLLLTLTAQAQSTIPLTLADAEALAASEPGQAALRAEAEALRNRGAAAGELPEPSLRVGLNNFPIESGGFSTEGMTQVAIGYRQMFPAGKTRELTEQRFGLLSEQMGERAHARGRDVLTAVRSGWLELFFLDRSEQMITEKRPLFADLAEITRSLYSVGRRTQQDVLRAELELSRLDDRLLDIERQRGRAQAALAEWIGPDAARPVANILPAWDELPSRQTLLEQLENHPSLQAAAARVRADETNVSIATERQKPQWALDIGYGYREGHLPSGQPRSDFVTLGVTVDMPWFRKRSVDSTLSAALHERTAARLSRETLTREFVRRLDVELSQWHELSQRLALYDAQILPQSREQTEAALLAYQSENGDFADVMRAYIGDLNTRIEHIRLKVDRAQSFAVLANLGDLMP